MTEVTPVAFPALTFNAKVDPIPPRLAIEASAGTGKTTSVVTIVRRLIGQFGVRPDEVLVTTFTRAAAAELRSRIRREIADRLASGECEEGERQALQSALEEIASIQVSTIHGFAQRTLASLGDRRAQLRPVASDARALGKAVADAVISLASQGCEVKSLSSTSTYPRRVGDLLNAPGAPAIDAGTFPNESVMSRVIEFAKGLFEQANTLEGVLTYGDLITSLEERLREGATAEHVARRYRLIVIDEFQDTDSHQWAIFESLVAAWGRLRESEGEGVRERTLVVVGDPKQSIYGFRGADLTSYARAVASLPKGELVTNYRSSDRLIGAFNTLFRDRDFHVPTGDLLNPADADVKLAEFPKNSIAYTQVEAPPTSGPDVHSKTRYLSRGTAVFSPITVKWVKPLAESVHDVAHKIEEDLIDWIVEEHGTGEFIEDGNRRGATWSDFCVLARTNSSARQAVAALNARGVPAALIGSTSVLTTDAAIHWRLLIRALMEPGSAASARLFASSWFVGADDHEIVGADEHAIGVWQQRLVTLRSALESGGPASLVADALEGGRVESRIVEFSAGVLRNITDFRHVAELLAQMPVRSDLDALYDAIDAAKYEAGGDDVEVDDELVARRIEGDDDAVRVMTVHASKGLEFNIVLIPDLWRTGKLGDPRTISLKRPDDEQFIRALVLRPGESEILQSAVYADTASERSRLYYVACTRARHRVVLWWADPAKMHIQWMNDLLTDPDEGINAMTESERGDLRSGFRVNPQSKMEWLRTSDDLIEVVECLPKDKDDEPVSESDAPGSDGDEVVEPRQLEARPFDVELPQPIRRWSYSRLIGRVAMPGATAPQVSGSEQQDFDDDDYNHAGDDGDEHTPLTAEPASEMKALPAGAGFGEYLHKVFEVTRLDADSLELEVSDVARALAPKYGYQLGEANDGQTLSESDIVDIVLRGLTTPLGAAYGDQSLVGIGQQRTLDELRFDLALPYDDDGVAVDAIGALIREHLGGHPIFGTWVGSLDFGKVRLRGSFNGAVDVVVATEVGGKPRVGIVDYKSNRLQAFDAEHMRVSMEEHAYPLQAIFYQVVLHRYLKARLRGYDARQHLGPALYLFVRGMGTDPSDPAAGIVTFEIPAALVEALSEMFAEGLMRP